MKYVISIVLALVLAAVVSWLHATAVAGLPLYVIAVAVALAATAFIEDIGRQIVWVIVAAIVAYVLENLMHQSWAGYVFVVAVGVLAASIAAILAPKGTGTAKPA